MCKSYCDLQRKETTEHKPHNQGSKSFGWLKQANKQTIANKEYIKYIIYLI